MHVTVFVFISSLPLASPKVSRMVVICIGFPTSVMMVRWSVVIVFHWTIGPDLVCTAVTYCYSWSFSVVGCPTLLCAAGWWKTLVFLSLVVSCLELVGDLLQSCSYFCSTESGCGAIVSVRCCHRRLWVSFMVGDAVVLLVRVSSEGCLLWKFFYSCVVKMNTWGIVCLKTTI